MCTNSALSSCISKCTFCSTFWHLVGTQEYFWVTGGPISLITFPIRREPSCWSTNFQNVVLLGSLEEVSALLSEWSLCHYEVCSTFIWETNVCLAHWMKAVIVFARVPDRPLRKGKGILVELVFANTFSSICLLGWMRQCMWRHTERYEAKGRRRHIYK